MNKSRVYKLLIVIFLILVIGFISTNHEIMGILGEPRKIKRYILHFHLLAPIAFVVLFTLRTLLFAFPAAIFAIIGGSVFGMGLGFFYSMVGAALSASLAFLIGRYLAKDLVNKYLSDKVKILRGSSKKGFDIVLYLRLIMVIPFDAFSYAVGATKITYKQFISGTIIGIMPEFILYSYLGYIGLKSDISLTEKLIFSAVIISIVFLLHALKETIIKRKGPKQKKDIKN